MKKLFTFLFVFTFAQLNFGQLSGTYYIGDAGTRPGGGDPEYTTLKSACDDVILKVLVAISFFTLLAI